MTAMLTALRRLTLKNTLNVMRLPVATAATLSGQRDNKAWPPALMFEGLEAVAKEFAGAFWRDHELAEEGHLQRVKVAELRRAAELEVKAAATRAEADERLEQQLAAAEQQRLQADQQAREREAAIERRKQEAEAQVEAEARRAEQVIAEIDEKREERVAATDRSARRGAATAESSALAKQRKALASVEKVVALDEAVEAKKAQRKRN